ncbi:hypothetical protein BC940DRAFT_302208 [Gongronella butleri]|nr:hypothetical protein BC940DRAFT_302208 [Gongronella butleri]
MVASMTTLPLTSLKIDSFVDELLSEFDEKRQLLYHGDAATKSDDELQNTIFVDDQGHDTQVVPQQDVPSEHLDIQESLEHPEQPKYAEQPQKRENLANEPFDRRAKAATGFHSHPTRRGTSPATTSPRGQGTMRYKNLLRRSSTYLRQRFFAGPPAATPSPPPPPMPLPRLQGDATPREDDTKQSKETPLAFDSAVEGDKNDKKDEKDNVPPNSEQAVLHERERPSSLAPSTSTASPNSAHVPHPDAQDSQQQDAALLPPPSPPGTNAAAAPRHPPTSPPPPVVSPCHYPPKPLVYAPVHPPNDNPHRVSLPTTLASWRRSLLHTSAQLRRASQPV